MVKIGKNVIESLTQSMYADSLFIFREYIQNSADAIDMAVHHNLLQSIDDGNIYINIDYTNKEISIEDNGTGIPASNAFSILTDVADSEKDRSKNKGFRGIGRLGGLAYCSELIFTTSAFGENNRTIIKWDCDKLKSILYDHSIKDDASTVIEIVTDSIFEPEELDKHYFKVQMNGVTNKSILDVDSVRTYLSVVAPVPYSTQFYYKETLYKFSLDKNLEIDEYNIFLNTDQILKPYVPQLYEGDNKNKRCYDQLFDISTFIIQNDNEIIAWGWLGLSEFVRQIPGYHNYFRGIRLRKGNIQIGDEHTLKKLHKEERSNSYFVGEIFCIHQDLIPNARRDYFVDNSTLKYFEKWLRNYFHTELYQYYHRANDHKNNYKKIYRVDSLKKEISTKSEKGFIGTEKDELDNKLKSAIKEAKDAKVKLDKTKSSLTDKDDNKSKNLTRIYEHIEKRAAKEYNIDIEVLPPVNKIDEEQPKLKFRTDNLSKLSKQERKLVSRIFEIIKETLVPEQAEELISKIEEDFH